LRQHNPQNDFHQLSGNSRCDFITSLGWYRAFTKENNENLKAQIRHPLPSFWVCLYYGVTLDFESDARVSLQNGLRIGIPGALASCSLHDTHSHQIRFDVPSPASLSLDVETGWRSTSSNDPSHLCLLLGDSCPDSSLLP